MAVVAITGAAGLLGGNVAAACAAAGWQVRALRRASSRIDHLAHLPLDWREVSFDRDDDLVRALAGATAVVHCAGETMQSRRLRAEHRHGNIALTLRVRDACRQAGVGRLVHCSTSVTCGFASPPAVATETTGEPVPWVDGYRASKQMAETDVLRHQAGLEVVVVNPGYLLGPLDAKPSSGRLLLLAARGRAIAWPAGGNSFVDVRDVADGIVAAVRAGRPGERYLLGGHNLSYRELLTRVAIAAGRRPPVVPVPFPVAATAGLAGDIVERLTGRPSDVNGATVRYGFSQGLRYSSAKAERELGYRIRPIDDTIRDAIAWFRQTGALPRN